MVIQPERYLKAAFKKKERQPYSGLHFLNPPPLLEELPLARTQAQKCRRKKQKK